MTFSVTMRETFYSHLSRVLNARNSAAPPHAAFRFKRAPGRDTRVPVPQSSVVEPGERVRSGREACARPKVTGRICWLYPFFYFSPYDMILLSSFTPASENEPGWRKRCVNMERCLVVRRRKRGGGGVWKQAGRGQGQGLYK